MDGDAAVASKYMQFCMDSWCAWTAVCSQLRQGIGLAKTDTSRRPISVTPSLRLGSINLGVYLSALDRWEGQP